MTPTRPRSLLVVLLALASLGLAACGSGDGAAEAQGGDGLRITDATIDWPANPEVAALRMRVHNDGAAADELVGASAEIARSVMVHRTTTDDQGRTGMAEATVVEVPARSTVTFEPGGLHVMLSGITTDLEVGDQVEVTLLFRDAGSVPTTALVVEPGTQDLGTGGDGEEAGHDH